MRVKQKRSKKILLIAILVLLALVVTALLWLYVFSNKEKTQVESSISNQSHSKSTKKESSTEKEGSSEDAGKSVDHEKEKELPQLYEGENINDSQGLTGYISSKAVQADTLIIRNTINQMVSSGSCELKLTKGSKVIVKTAEILQNPSSASCAGFDVPVSELSPGNWSIEINITGDNKKMTIKEAVDI